MKLLLAGVLMACTIQLTWAQEVQDQLAWQYYRNGEYAKAAPLYLQLYESKQAKTYLHYYIICQIGIKEYETTIEVVRKAIRRTRDIALYVDMGYLYEQAGDSRRAMECYQEPIKEFPQTMEGITALGNVYVNYGQFEYAEMTYEFGRKILGNPDEFRFEMGQVYYAQRRFQAMVDEYFALLLSQPQYMPTVQAMIRNALEHDVDQTLLQMTLDKTYASIQQLPGIPVYYDMLIWVLIQKNDYLEAVNQTIAMDRRNHSPGEKTLQLARQASDEGFTDAALTAYRYLIDQGPEAPSVNTGRVKATGSVYRAARIEYLLTRIAKQEEETIRDRQSWLNLSEQIQQTIDDLGKSTETIALLLEWARLRSEYLGDYPGALALIEEILVLPGLYPGFRTESLLLKGDVQLVSGDPWEANFTYAMIALENPDNVSGATARFRKAQLAWFTGNIPMAMAQLEVIKGSTSQPIANDAFELSLLIRENRNESDSSNGQLDELAAIDYLIFKKDYTSALTQNDSILQSIPQDEPAFDDFLYRKGSLLFRLGRNEEAVQVYGQLLDRYRYEYWGHKALFELGCWYQDQLKDDENATRIFNDFIRDFPNSFYFLDARDRLKALLDRSAQ